MPLFVRSSEVESKFIPFEESLKEIYNSYRNDAMKFRSQATKIIKKEEIKKHLYVSQREVAVVLPDDKSIEILGSDDATTCLIICIRHNATGATLISHFDGTDTESHVDSCEKLIVKAVEFCTKKPFETQENNFDFHLIGGFNDLPRCLSKRCAFQTLGEGTERN